MTTLTPEQQDRLQNDLSLPQRYVDAIEQIEKLTAERDEALANLEKAEGASPTNQRKEDPSQKTNAPSADRLWIDDTILEHAAKLLEQNHCPTCMTTLGDDVGPNLERCPYCSTDLGDDYDAVCEDSAKRLRTIAAAAKASETIGSRGWPVALVEVQATGKGMRRP